MDNIINYVKDHSLIFIIIGSLLFIVLYSMIAVFLNKLNNGKYGKTTVMAWIFPFNIYLLGKLVLHSLVGLLLVIGLLFGICISFNLPGLETIHNLLPKEYVLPYQITYGAIILLFFIVAKIKLKKLIKNGYGKDTASAFINKDYNKPEPVIVVDKPLEEVKEMIEDNYQYKHTSLSELNTHNNENDNNNP